MEKATTSHVKVKILLIFAKMPEEGQCKTRLCPPLTHREAARLYGAMTADVVGATARLTDLDRRLCYAPSPAAAGHFAAAFPGLTIQPQRGDSLGERLISAFAEAFAAGAEQAAVIGTDAPDLPPALIGRAFATLASAAADAVFGPTEDGGYYLVALSRPCPTLFTDIPWSTAHVLRTSLERAEAAGIAVALLPPWRDIDTWEDLEPLLSMSQPPMTATTLASIAAARPPDRSLHTRGTGAGKPPLWSSD